MNLSERRNVINPGHPEHYGKWWEKQSVTLRPGLACRRQFTEVDNRQMSIIVGLLLGFFVLLLLLSGRSLINTLSHM